ncbi:M28 family peptidase [Thalassotalea litorea]|uniref:M28 family peptidase n=1 Tax=Thalassotalea litorea TaxID=2020715 RepID=UPI0037355BDF
MVFSRIQWFMVVVLLASRSSYSCNDSGEVAWQHLQILGSSDMAGRGPGQAGHILAQAYISQTWERLGNSQLVRHDFHYTSGLVSKTGTNWLLFVPAQVTTNSYMIIAAHYDHLGKKGTNVYFGADDNASGTAALLALSECFSEHEFYHNLVYIAFDREEQGLKGASAFVRNYPHIIKNTRIMVNLDMIAHGARNSHYWLTGTKRWQQFQEVVENTNRDVDIPFKPRRHLSLRSDSMLNTRIDLHKASDHYEFYKAGVPYLFITGDNHMHYHTPADTISTIDQNFYRSGVKSIATLINYLDTDL